MKIADFIMGLLVLGFFITAASMAIGDLSNTYEINNTQNTELFNSFNATYTLSQNMSENLQGRSVQGSDPFSTLASGVFSSVKLSFSSIGTTNEILNAVARAIHLPIIVIQLIIGLLMVFITFQLAGAIFKGL